MSSIKNFSDLEKLEVPFSHSDKVFIPTPHNKPEERKPLINVKDQSFLTYQNISTILSPPGAGKSSVCEAICSSLLNKDCDSLGIIVSDEVKRILFIDSERSEIDVWKSYRNIGIRSQNREVSPDKILLAGFREILRIKDKIECTESLLKMFTPQILVIDGIADFMHNSNDLMESGELEIWIRSLTQKYNVSILLTIHPNKGTYTPRGHLGSELCRRSESVLAIKKEGVTRVLTSDFEHGKNRNGALIESAFLWSDEKNYFISCDAPTGSLSKIEPWVLISNEEIRTLIGNITKGKDISTTEFRDALRLSIKTFFPRSKTSQETIALFIAWLKENSFIYEKTIGRKKCIKLREVNEQLMIDETTDKKTEQ
jgi:hypothetical protein